MEIFSKRNGYNDILNGLETASPILKQKIYSTFYKREYHGDELYNKKTTGIEDMMIEMGINYKFPSNFIYRQENEEKLRGDILNNENWYTIFDFIEKYLNICDNSNEMEKEFNRILESEDSAYRICNKMVIPITNELEIKEIEGALNIDAGESVRIHIAKALKLFSNRERTDYENSIKESISAVESMCCIITEEKGKNATLGNALKKLKDRKIYIHSAMEKGFLALYGYTSDESGIRHGGIDFTNANFEDAKYMLVSCSAFVNYLMQKWIKIGRK